MLLTKRQGSLNLIMALTCSVEAQQTNGTIYYDHYRRAGSRFETFYQETFEEALAIVNQSTNQDMSQPLQP